jgi:uncharacterized protein
MTQYNEFQVFVKPAGPACNLNCSYCYYLGKKEFFGRNDRFLMSNEILERYIRQHIDASKDGMITFSWHGGEPLLAGIDFFRKAIAIQTILKPPGKEITNGIQTNGTLLDDDWCSFLSSNGFTVGISIDGPGILHDANRRTKNGHGTFTEVMRGFNLLQMHGLNPEILCVVNAVNVGYPLEVYNLFRKLGAEYIAFLPLVEKEEGSQSGVSNNSVPALKFGQFLCTIFDEWVEKDIGRIKVQVFEEAARSAFGQEQTLCIFKTECGGVPVIEHNGDFFSCDHYVDELHKTGNIMEDSLVNLLNSEKQKAFGTAKSSTLPDYCRRCEVKPMCNGECPKNRISVTPDGEPGLNYLCEGYKYFFNHCRPFVEAVAEEWRKNIK